MILNDSTSLVPIERLVGVTAAVLGNPDTHNSLSGMQRRLLIAIFVGKFVGNGYNPKRITPSLT